MEANKRGRSEANVKSKLKTSMAKMMAAMVALKIAEIAPAAAHPITQLRVAWFKCNKRDKFEAIPAPPETVGPSKPVEPPKPMVIGAVNKDANI